MLLINRIHKAKTNFALAESRAAHSKVLSFSPSKKNMKKNSAAQKNDAVPTGSDVLGQYFQNFNDEDDLGLGLFANDGDNGAFDKSFVDYSSDSDSEALFQKHRGSKKINLPSSNARSKLMGSLAQTTKGVPDPSSFIDDFGGSFVFEDEGDIRMNTSTSNSNNNNSFGGNDDFGGDDFGDSFGNDGGDENIDSSGSPKSPSPSLTLSSPDSLLDGANKSGNETSPERPRKTARLYKIVGDANTKLSSATILLWMNNKGPTMKVRKLSRHYIPKHRRSLDFNAAMNRPAYSQSRNIYTKTNIAWRRFMEYVPPSIILRQRHQAGVRSPEVGRNDSGASVNRGEHGGEHLMRDEEMEGGENRDKRKRASLGDDDMPGQYDNGYDDWGGNDFGNDDFGDEINGASALMSLSGSKGGSGKMKEGKIGLAGGGAAGGGAGGAGGAANGGKRGGKGSRWTAVSESDVIWTLEQHGMKEGISVDFHSACFELLDEDDDIGMTEEKRKRLPSREVAASYFFSLLIASNNFKVRARQEEPWGRIRVESMGA